MSDNHYIVKSLELHLFFGRIMKERALFLRAGFTPANSAFSKKAEFYKNEFEKLLSEAVALSNGIVSSDVLNSGEVVTYRIYFFGRKTNRMFYQHCYQ